jgi:anti-sigma regulatory factor (Ser/Thr protein kinase)
MRWHLPRDATAAADARAHVRAELPLARPASIHAAVLMTDELVANAVLYGTDPIVLELDVSPDQLFVAVVDGSPARPVVGKDPGGPSTHGRGLFLVDALSSRWGVDSEEPGKRVWFELDLGS